MTFRPLPFLVALAAFTAGFAFLRAQPAPDAPPTVIECAGLSETVSTDTETTAIFRDKVVVTGNNLKLTCDYLKVVASRKGDPKATIGKYGYFKTLVASGNVKIIQGDREATCGHAEIFPGEDRVVISRLNKTGPFPSIRVVNPVTRVVEYEGSGPRMVLYRGERKAVVEPEDGVGGRFTLPAIKDLGFDNKSKAKPAPATSPAVPEPAPKQP
jgi:lipopolysaccharide export system protein LptA